MQYKGVANKATEALMWNFYMDHIYAETSEAWRSYWSRFRKHFLMEGEHFCLEEVKGSDLPLDKWSFMKLTTRGKNGKRIEIISDKENPDKSRINVYNKETDKLVEVMTPNLDIGFKFKE